MAIIQTAERSSQHDPSENVIFQRHLIAYKEAKKLINGTVLELGSGEGYGVLELAPFSEKYYAVDKFTTHIPKEFNHIKKIKFIQSEFPPLTEINDNSIDYVVTFQVIEHIYEDGKFLQEIYRVLKKGGKLVVADILYNDDTIDIFNMLNRFAFSKLFNIPESNKITISEFKKQLEEAGATVELK